RRARQVIATTVELHLRVGNPAGAEQALHELPGGWECSSEYEQLTRARLLLAQHNPESALGALADLEQRAATDGRDGSLIPILPAPAGPRAELGKGAAAGALRPRTAQLGAREGSRRPFLDEGDALAPLLRDARGPAPEFGADLLARAARGRARRSRGQP